MPCAISLQLSSRLISDLGELPTGEIVFSSCIYFGVCWLVAALSLFEISLFVTVGIIPGSRICILDVCVSRILCSAGDFAAVLNVTQCIDYDLKYFRTPVLRCSSITSWADFIAIIMFYFHATSAGCIV